MSEEEILKKAMGHFKTRLALIRMGIPVRKDHPVSDDEYRAAVDRPDYCRCAFADPDGTVVPGDPCPIHPEVMP